MMKRLMTSTLTAAAVALGAMAAAQNVPGTDRRPGEPDPTDRGGEFTVIGCLEQAPAGSGEPATFKLTHVTTATGQGRMASAQGAGVPVGQGDSVSSRPSDPPDLIPGEYRIVAGEDVDLAEHADQQVQLRGSLSEDGMAAATARVQQGAEAAAGRTTAGGGEPVFIATEVMRVSDTCAEAGRQPSQAQPGAESGADQDRLAPQSRP